MRAERASLLGRPTRANLVLREGQVRSRTVIEAKGISKSSPREEAGTRHLVQDFTTRVPPGAHIAIPGPNRAGKATLLHLLICNLPLHAGKVAVHTPPTRPPLP